MTNTTPFIAPLTLYSIVRVSGVDAETFLQGQLSCDLKEVTLEQSRMGTANTPKGRAYAAFRIAKLDDDYLIRLPSELTQDFVTRLSKYIVFSKAKISIEEHWCVLGFVVKTRVETGKEYKAYPQNVDGTTTENDKIIIKVPSSTAPRYEIWCTQDVALPLIEAQKENTGTEADWDSLEVTEGIAEIFTQTQESFVPQMLNLQHLNAISFKKGCYTGQEIIARMKYLGKLKKSTFLLAVSPAIEVHPGASVFELGSDKKKGIVVRTAVSTSESGNTTLALAVLDIESVKSGVEFSLSENSKTSAKRLPLPYEE